MGRTVITIATGQNPKKMIENTAIEDN